MTPSPHTAAGHVQSAAWHAPGQASSSAGVLGGAPGSHCSDGAL
jgi:hypothetical protein